MHGGLSFGLDRTTRKVLVRLGATLGALLIATGCDRSGEDPREDMADSKTAKVAAVDRLGHYGLGRSVSAEEIALWDIDVMPDGEGLPEGSGTVEAGRLLYFERCQGCHGAHGRDGPFDTLAGRLPDDEFPFALDRSVRRSIDTIFPRS